MTDVDFNEIHTMTMGEITEPKKVKTGTWRGRIETGTLKYKNGEDNGPIAKSFFGIKTLEPVEVSPSILDDVGDLTDTDPVFYQIAVWDRRGYWPIRRFLRDLGVEFEESDDLGEVCKRAKGYMVQYHITERHNKKDPENPYFDVESIEIAD